MLSFEGHMATKAVEEAAQHEAQGFRLLDGAAVPDVKQYPGQIRREARVGNVLAAQPVGGQGATAVRDRLFVGRENHGFFIVMRQPQRRQKRGRDLQACQVIDVGGQAIGDGFELSADRDLPVVDSRHRLGHAQPSERLARQATGFTWP